MFVPSFVPPPVEIDGNVADQPYRLYLRFTKTVIVLHLAGVGLVLAGSFTFPDLLAQIPHPEAWALGLLILLSAIRGAFRGLPIETILSLPFAMAFLTTLAAILAALDQPEPVAIAPIALAIYTVACGRDLSLFGLFSLGSIAAFVTLLIASVVGGLTGFEALGWSVFSAAYLGYVAYDLAMITRRRRPGEALGGAIDLYRDLLNFVTYPIRILLHWHKHRLWRYRLRVGDRRAAHLNPRLRREKQQRGGSV